MGDGGNADDFHENESALLFALDYYLQHKYKVILVGDIEEFWQFDLDQIQARYQDTVYEKFREFQDRNVIRIFGNHDLEWKSYPDPTRNKQNIHPQAYEAVKIHVSGQLPEILVTHGHQGSTESDKFSWYSRIFVRMFKTIEPIAKWFHLYGHPSAPKSQIVKEYERILYQWAKKERKILICGHSHRAIFAARSYADQLREQIASLQADNLMNRENRQILEENLKKIELLREKLMEEKDKGRDIDRCEKNGDPLPIYFNTGCALYTDGLTCIELNQKNIRLVKWARDGEQQVYGEMKWQALKGSLPW